MHRRRIRALGVALAIAALTSACGGPGVPIEIGAKEIPVDIVLGAQRGGAPPAPGSNNEPIGFPGFIQPPVPRPDPGVPPPPPPPPPACPLANPLDPALLVARETASAPVPAVYTYRNQGTLKVGDAAATEYPPAMTREVRNVALLGESGASFEFEIAATMAGETTVTTYRVLNDGVTPDRGVYITRIVTERPDGSDSFAPDAPLLLMPFPSPEYGTNLENEIDQYRGQRYRSVATDPLSRTTIVLEAMLVGKTRVDACGKWVDAFDVEVTLGSIVGPNRQLQFTGHYAIATQYGALVVEDDIAMSGTDRGEEIESRNRSRINSLPVEPRG